MYLPLISIIISIYNGEKYLGECIRSVINQSYSNIEIILVNDGSTDLSGKIADDFSNIDNRIRVIHKKNEGVSESRNIAINQSQGEYICIVDQDDILSKYYISYFYNLITEYDAQIALTPKAKKFYKKPDLRQKLSDKVEVWSGQKTTEEMLYHKIIIAPWNKMIKKELIDSNHVRFNPNFFGGEGFAFSIQCYQYAKRIVVGSQYVYHYRVGNTESGASKFRESTIYSSLNSQKYIKDILANPTPALYKAWRFSNWHTHCDCLNIIVGCGAEKEYEKLYKTLKKVCQQESLCALAAPVSIQQKLRGILFRVNPYMASCIINHFRIRKFKNIGEKSK